MEDCCLVKSTSRLRHEWLVEAAERMRVILGYRNSLTMDAGPKFTQVHTWTVERRRESMIRIL